MRTRNARRFGTQPAALHQRGIGMVEVLIALIVISFGVLGMAGLQLTGMKQSTNGFNRAKAVMLAEDMATRMRINRSGITAGMYTPFDSTSVSCAAPPAPFCQAYGAQEAQVCDAAELAAFDQYAVSCGDRTSTGSSGGIADLLPANSQMLVTCDDADCDENASYLLRVQWLENVNASSESDSDQQTSVVQMRLRP